MDDVQSRGIYVVPFVAYRIIFACKKMKKEQEEPELKRLQTINVFLCIFPFPSSVGIYFFLFGNIGRHKIRILTQEPHNFSTTFIITISFLSFFRLQTSTVFAYTCELFSFFVLARHIKIIKKWGNIQRKCQVNNEVYVNFWYCFWILWIL